MLTAITILLGVLVMLVLMLIGLPLMALLFGFLPVLLAVLGVCFLIGALTRRRPYAAEDFLPAAAALGAAVLLHLL